MSESIQKYNATGLSLREIDYLGKIFVASKRFRDVIEAAQAITQIIAGQELGFSPMVSMTKINIINGKVSMSAELMASMIKRSNIFDYKVVDHTTEICKIQFYKNNEQGYLSTFTIEDAKRAGLIKSGGGWEKYPRAMLFSRALSQGARIECPHLINGAYTDEEMGANVSEDGEVISIETVEPENGNGKKIEQKPTLDIPSAGPNPKQLQPATPPPPAAEPTSNTIQVSDEQYAKFVELIETNFMPSNPITEESLRKQLYRKIKACSPDKFDELYKNTSEYFQTLF